MPPKFYKKMTVDGLTGSSVDLPPKSLHFVSQMSSDGANAPVFTPTRRITDDKRLIRQIRS